MAAVPEGARGSEPWCCHYNQPPLSAHHSQHHAIPLRPQQLTWAVSHYHPHSTDEGTGAQRVSHDHTAPKRCRLPAESEPVLRGA